LGGRGLASAIRSAAEGAGVTVVVDTPAGAGYPAGTIAAVYWSCVDALTAATHGSQATVVVSDNEGALTFDISIAGRLDEGRIDRLRDRIEALDGRLTVDDRPDGGARVQGWLPLSR
jgi:hypothetical protein